MPMASEIEGAGEYDPLIDESRLDDRHVRRFRSWVLDEALHARDMRPGAQTA